MPHNRFFADSDFTDTDLLIHDEEAHHIMDVMRLNVGDTLELINGRGTLAHARIKKIAKKEISVEIETVLSVEKTGPSITSGLPLLRPGHFDWAIEKIIEVGIDRILIFSADYSERKEIYSSFHTRLKKLTESAMKQSGRLFAPIIVFYKDLLELLEQEQGLVLWADESGTTSFWETLERVPPSTPLLLLSGPEKGWSKREKTHLLERAQPALLTRTTLRAETAAILMAGMAMQKTRIF